MTRRRALAVALALLAFATFATLGATGAVADLEVGVMRGAEGLHGPVVDAVAVACAKGLGGLGLAALTVLAAGLFWLRGARRDALVVAGAMVFGFALLTALKLAFGRARPEVFAWLAPADGASLPSGHAMMNAVFWPLVAWVAPVRSEAWWWRWRWLLALGLPVIVAASRVEAGVHWPTDVLAGLALGGALVLLAGAFRADTPA